MAEFRGCDPSTLNCVDFIERTMRAAAKAAGATVVQSTFHKFGPHGVSGVLVLAESHLSVHTWPESDYAATDIYTCGTSCQPERAHEVLQRAFRASSCEFMALERGLHGPDGMRVVRHQVLPLESEYSGEFGEESPQTGQRVDRP